MGYGGREDKGGDERGDWGGGLESGMGRRVGVGIKGGGGWGGD